MVWVDVELVLTVFHHGNGSKTSITFVIRHLIPYCQQFIESA